jgi:ribokinase
VESYKIEVVDSNGAGDCFNASLASALAAKKSLEESALYANAVSALCCTKWETVPSYHTAAQVEEFIKEHGKKEIEA